MNDRGNYSPAEFTLIVLELIKRAGSQRALARRLGINQRYVSDAVTGKRAPARRLLAALGFVRVDEHYRKYQPLEWTAEYEQLHALLRGGQQG